MADKSNQMVLDALSRAVDLVGQSLGGQALANGTSRTDLAEVVVVAHDLFPFGHLPSPSN